MRSIVLTSTLLLLGFASDRAAASLPDLPNDTVAAAVPLRARPFDLADVRLGDGPFRDAMLRDKAYLLHLDPDRLLHNFRVNVGLPSTAKPYGGWEAPNVELRGHAVGHYLSACALMYRSTADTELRQRIDTLVAGLAKCQAAAPSAGFHPGYLSAFPESLIDRVIAGKPAWAPWYTLHKIMAGLLDAYQLAGNRQALDVLVKEAAWVGTRLDPLSHAQLQTMLQNEFGGMNEVLANLYAITGNPGDLRLARDFDHDAVFDPLARGVDALDGLHANTQIPKMIGAARQYELTGDPHDCVIAENFWSDVALRRSFVIGGHSDHEHFFPPADFAAHLSNETAETCNTYNMLKLTRHLFEWSPDAARMDFYERALYNHILGSQDPETGMFVYLMPLKPGQFKSYSTPEDSFWCCVGTGMENHAKYGDTIFFNDGADGLFVNLFISAQLNWSEKGVTVVQDTKFPDEAGTHLTIHTAKPIELAVRIRHPGWVEGAMPISVNGQPVAVDAAHDQPRTYRDIRRVWHDGDRIDVSLPMALHTESLPNAPGIVAVLYGPIVLAADLGEPAVPVYVHDQLDDTRVPVPDAPVFVRAGADREWLHSIVRDPAEPLAFSTHGLAQPGDVKLVPIYTLHRRRMAVYWPLLTPNAYAQRQKLAAEDEARIAAAQNRALDRVVAGNADSEKAHGFETVARSSDGYASDTNTQTGTLEGHSWRNAFRGGWFSYVLRPGAEAAAKPLAIACTFAGNDVGFKFDILVEGTKVGTEDLEGGHPSQFFEQDFPIPPELTRGKQSLTVKFQAPRWGVAGNVFSCALVPQE